MADSGIGWILPLWAAFFFIWLLVVLGVYAIMAWMLSRVFRKAGIDEWKAWVPVYNAWVLLELGRQPGWMSLLMFIPFANIVAAVFMALAAYKISIGFGKDGAWTLMYVFVPIVWITILAFDTSAWQPWRIPAPGAPFGYAAPSEAGPPGTFPPNSARR